MMSTISWWLFGVAAGFTALAVVMVGAAILLTHADAIREELRADKAAIRERGLGARALVVVETVLALGLFVRACLHTIVYLTSGLGGRPDVSIGLRWSPLSGRPLWNEWTARLFTAVCGLWFAQAVTLGWGWPPLIEQALRIVYATNAAVLVGDPLVGAAHRFTTMHEQTRSADGGTA